MTTSRMHMNLDAFLDHLDRLGPAVDAWPESIRAAAMATVAGSPEAQAALNQARQLDERLATLPRHPAPAHLAGRIAAEATSRVSHEMDPWQRLIAWFGGALWRPALAASIPLAFGFAIGVGLQAPPADDADLVESVGLMPFSMRFEVPADEE